MTEIKGYPERWLLAVCCQLYEAPIAKRTWDKFKDICRVPDLRKQTGDRFVPKTNCLWLMCLCYLKAQKRHEWELVQQQKLQRHDLNWAEKRKIMDALKNGHVAGTKYRVNLNDVIAELHSSARLPNGQTRKQALEDALGDAVLIGGVLGRDVPLWLEKQTGVKLTIRTLQRKAKEAGLRFSLPNPTPPETLNYFLDIYWIKAV